MRVTCYVIRKALLVVLYLHITNHGAQTMRRSSWLVVRGSKIAKRLHFKSKIIIKKRGRGGSIEWKPFRLGPWPTTYTNMDPKIQNQKPHLPNQPPKKGVGGVR